MVRARLRNKDEMMNTKIQLNDSMQDVMFKMSEGNPGALNVCVQILKEGARIDPDDIMGGLGTILSLDTLGLYGSKIWMLYKGVCGGDLPKMLAVLRGCQLGFVTDAQLRRAVDAYGEGLDVPAVCAQVSERLPRFQFGQRPNA